MQQKFSHIQLGGQKKYSYNSVVNPQNKQYYHTTPTQNTILNRAQSKQAIISTHQIPGKKSPSKNHLHSHLTSRKGSIINQNSFIQFGDSSLQTPSISNTVYRPRSPLHETANTSPQRQLIKVNFVNTSPNKTQTSSVVDRRQMKIGVNKMMNCGQTKEQILQRKLKVLQGRIGELHKQKHELSGRLNEQNRRIYHQNTSLKLKINDLINKIDKDTHNSNVIIKPSVSQQTISKYQAQIQELTQKNNLLCQRYDSITHQLQQSQTQGKKLQSQNESLNKKLQEKQQAYQSLHSQYLHIQQQRQNLNSLKQKYEQDLQQIQKSITENSKYNAIIIQEYQYKLQEYKQAYDKNQEIIQQLSHQLEQQFNSHNAYPQQDQILIRDTEGGQILQECQNLQNNFLSALDQKDELISELQKKNQEIQSELAHSHETIEQLSTINQQQTRRLEQVGSLLERYTLRIKDLENKYEQICKNSQQQKQKNTQKTEAVQRCKKCDQLTKTIFRLNSHLNKKN